MSARRNQRILRRSFSFDTAEDSTRFVAEMVQRSRPGTALAVALDDRRKLVDFHVVEDGGDHPAEILTFTVVCGDRRTRQVLLVTDRSDDVLADRPDDELTWQELVALADDLGVRLLDWWVTSGTQAFSVAEFAPTPAAW